MRYNNSQNCFVKYINKKNNNWLGAFEGNSGNSERAIKHLTIAASSGHYSSMHFLMLSFQQDCISRESIDAALAAYNSSCAEMRSEARDDYIRSIITDTM